MQNIGESTLNEIYHQARIQTLSEEKVKRQKRSIDTMDRAMSLFTGKPLQGDIIDIGQGDGAMVQALNRDPKNKALGIDINDGVNFEKDPFPFKDGSFDCAILYSVIEHIYNAGNLMSETSRILKKDGVMIFIMPNIVTAKEQFYNDPTHIHPYTPTAIHRLMGLYRFEKKFLGLWTVGKSDFFWKLPMEWQMNVGKYLPFSGETKFVPAFLKGKSTSMMGIYQKP